MKLFSPEEIKTSKAAELARDVFRTQDIKKALDSARTTLNDTKALFDVTLANQRVAWATEQEKAIKTISDLQKEVSDLEGRRQTLLIPIDIDRKKVDNMIMEANEFLTQAIQKQKDADELVEKLEDRLEEVSEKDEALTQRENNLLLKEKGAEAQSNAVILASSELTKQMQSFVADMENKENVFNTKKKELDLYKITLDGLSEDLKKQSEHLAREKQLIFSQRQALRTALQDYDKRTKRQ